MAKLFLLTQFEIANDIAAIAVCGYIPWPLTAYTSIIGTPVRYVCERWTLIILIFIRIKTGQAQYTKMKELFKVLKNI